MRLLILGGTVFLGRHLVEAAQNRGHAVTIFPRGQRNPDLFPDVERLWGDRDSDLQALKGRQWDTAIDTSGYVPRVVAASAQLLADATEHYTFISSISVYADPNRGASEDSPVGTLSDTTVEQITGETYGPLNSPVQRAVAAGLRFRPLAETIRDTLAWDRTRPTDTERRAGLKPDREAELLAAWHAQQ